MPLALRPHFGPRAGGIEHAFALATLAHASRPMGAPLLSYPTTGSEFDAFSRLVTLLEDVVAHAEYTIDDLRREGFAEPVLSALRLGTTAHPH